LGNLKNVKRISRVAQNRDRTFWISEEWPDSRRISKNLKESQRISLPQNAQTADTGKESQRISKHPNQHYSSNIKTRIRNIPQLSNVQKKRKEKRKPKKDKKKEKKR